MLTSADQTGQDWATGPSDRRAAGPSRAVGRGPWAAGRWAAGLLLAKPVLWGLWLKERGTHMSSTIFSACGLKTREKF